MVPKDADYFPLAPRRVVLSAPSDTTAVMSRHDAAH